MVRKAVGDRKRKGFKAVGEVLGMPKAGQMRLGSGKKGKDDFLQDSKWTKDKYISHEWQGYAVKLAEELNDRKHIKVYMKMARDLNRSVLERARMFVRDAVCDNPAKLFMWKVGQLNKEQKKEKQRNSKE